jgi:hypothetical protein
MARKVKRRGAGPTHRKRRGRWFVAFERAVLGVGMTMVAYLIERRLIKAIKKGGVKPAPRTAAESEEALAGGPAEVREGELTTAPHQVGDQTQH